MTSFNFYYVLLVPISECTNTGGRGSSVGILKGHSEVRHSWHFVGQMSLL